MKKKSKIDLETCKYIKKHKKATNSTAVSVVNNNYCYDDDDDDDAYTAYWQRFGLVY